VLYPKTTVWPPLVHGVISQNHYLATSGTRCYITKPLFGHLWYTVLYPKTTVWSPLVHGVISQNHCLATSGTSCYIPKNSTEISPTLSVRISQLIPCWRWNLDKISYVSNLTLLMHSARGNYANGSGRATSHFLAN